MYMWHACAHAYLLGLQLLQQRAHSTAAACTLLLRVMLLLVIRPGTHSCMLGRSIGTVLRLLPTGASACSKARQQKRCRIKSDLALPNPIPCTRAVLCKYTCMLLLSVCRRQLTSRVLCAACVMRPLQVLLLLLHAVQPVCIHHMPCPQLPDALSPNSTSDTMAVCLSLTTLWQAVSHHTLQPLLANTHRPTPAACLLQPCRQCCAVLGCCAGCSGCLRPHGSSPCLLLGLELRLLLQLVRTHLRLLLTAHSRSWR